MKKKITIIASFCLMLFTLNTQANVIYQQMNLTADQTSTWLWFEWGPDTDGFGLWVNPGAALRIETYQDDVIGYDDGGMIFLTALDYETEIGPDSDWQTPSEAVYVNDATHTELNGSTFYAGFKLKSADNEIFYGWMQFEVAQDGLSFTLIDMAYEDVAGAPILAGVVERQVIYDAEIFTEDLLTNDGHIMNQLGIQLLGVNFTVTGGAMVENTHYTVENIPEGLSIEINAIDAVNASIALNGQAQAHNVSDTVNNLTVNFLDEAFDGVPAADVINASKADLFVKYFGEYEIVYEDLPDPVCGTGGWVPFQSAYYENYFGIWHDGTDMRLETYGKDVVGEMIGDMSYVTPLDTDTPINGESAWVPSAVWPNEAYLTSATYTNWMGQDKYAGIKLVLGEAEMYGWVHLGVSGDGTEITVFDWAFNTNPNTQIKAGQQDNTAVVSNPAEQFRVYPNPCAGYLEIFTEEQAGTMSIELMDLLGKVHQKQIVNLSGQQKINLDMSTHSAGIYIVRVSCGEIVYTRKIIKQ